MSLYRTIVPEPVRTQIRNLQYIFHDFVFFLRLLSFKLFSQKKHYLPKTDKHPSICYIIPTSRITGGVAVVCEHLNRLQKLGYKCLVATMDTSTDLSWFPTQTVPVVTLKQNRGLIESFDIVIATGWITAYELLLLNARRKIYFVQSDETRFYPKGSYLKTRVKRTYTFPFEYMTEAKWIKKWLKESFSHNAAYVPNGVNTDIFYPDTPLEPKPKNRKRVLLEGAINLPFKGMAEAFEVVKDLDCEVWCVSNDGRPKPEWRCDRFFEKVPMEMMRRIYSSCDILLKLSRVEGFFGPPLEMMACGGVPVVAKVTGYDEYIVDGHNALVTKVGNIDNTRLLINKLLTDQNLYTKLLSKTKNTVQNYSWNNTIDVINSFFSKG